MAREKTILIYRLGSLGDTIIALPCFHLVRQVYPDARITLLTNEPVSGKAAPAMDILENSGLCDDSISYPIGTRSFGELARLRCTLRELQPDLLVNLAPGRGWLKTLRDEIYFRACGVRKIIGSPYRKGELEVHRSSSGLFESEAQRLASRLQKLGSIDLADRNAWDLKLTDAEKKLAAELLPADAGDVVAISLGTKLPVKDWGPAKWGRLLNQLSSELSGATLVLLGSEDEWKRSEQSAAAWAGNRINLCGKTSPRVAAAILERCRLFIGHDSGPMHLACVAGVPTIGIFSWLNPPGQWFPGHPSWSFVKTIYPPLPGGRWNPGLQMKQSVSEGIGLTQPEAVLKAALELWPATSIEPQKAMRARSSPNASAAPLSEMKSGMVIPPAGPFQQAKAV